MDLLLFLLYSCLFISVGVEIGRSETKRKMFDLLSEEKRDLRHFYEREIRKLKCKIAILEKEGGARGDV